MLKHEILFVCIHNSARSQMAEAFLNKNGGDFLHAESAGLEPGKLNQNVVEVMKEAGIDISHKGTQGVFDLFRQGRKYDAVITVCDEASAEQCPIFPCKSKRVAWSFPDPSSFTGSRAEILDKTRAVRDLIKKKVAEFIAETKDYEYWL